MIITVGDIALINNDAPQLIYCCSHPTCAYEIAGSAMYTHGSASLPCTRPFILAHFSITYSKQSQSTHLHGVCYKKNLLTYTETNN